MNIPNSTADNLLANLASTFADNKFQPAEPENLGALPEDQGLMPENKPEKNLKIWVYISVLPSRRYSLGPKYTWTPRIFRQTRD